MLQFIKFSFTLSSKQLRAQISQSLKKNKDFKSNLNYKKIYCYSFHFLIVTLANCNSEKS